MVKISDKINQAHKEGRNWMSLEFFPPKTQDGWANLYDRIERMKLLGPIFIDITFVKLRSLHLAARSAENRRSGMNPQLTRLLA